VFKRLERVHMNCVENRTFSCDVRSLDFKMLNCMCRVVPIFAALVLSGYASGLVSDLFNGASIAFVIGRLVQSIAHLIGLHELLVQIRFTGMLTQVVCGWIILGEVLSHMKNLP
jgi:hypothetical protein